MRAQAFFMEFGDRRSASALRARWRALAYADALLAVCVCLLLQDLVQSCLRAREGGGIVEDTCYERRRAEACVD